MNKYLTTCIQFPYKNNHIQSPGKQLSPDSSRHNNVMKPPLHHIKIVRTQTMKESPSLNTNLQQFEHTHTLACTPVHSDKDTDRLTERQACRQKDNRTDKQTGRRTDRHAHTISTISQTDNVPPQAHPLLVRLEALSQDITSSQFPFSTVQSARKVPCISLILLGPVSKVSVKLHILF